MIAANRCGIGIGQPPRFGLLAAALAGDHVGRDGPRAAGKPDQRLVGRERGLHLAHGLVDRLEPRRLRRQLVERGVDQRRRQARPFAGDEGQILADRERHDEDVGKQDRGVELGESARSGWSVTSAAASLS